jgi:hypothetical protein
MMKRGGAAKQELEAALRTILGLFLAVTSTACVARTINLGGGDAAPPEGVDAGVHVASTTLATCTSASEMSADLGNGFNDERPPACTAAQGPAQAVTSAADVASRIVGLWYDCTHQSFGVDGPGDDEKAIQLTSDGRYVSYGSDASGTLVPLGSPPGDPDLEDAGSPATATSGTFTVVDGSATYGAGTYELQLHPTDGGLFKGEVVITTSPVQLLFLPTNGMKQVFTSPLPWSPRAGACSCVNTSANPAFEDDAVGLASAIVGRWIWCAGDGPPVGNIGIEFATGNTWYELDEDQSGQVTRGTGSLEHGTFSIEPTASLNLSMTGPEPLTVNLDQGSQGMETQLLYFANPRMLLFAVGTLISGGQPPVVTNNYSTCFPMP